MRHLFRCFGFYLPLLTMPGLVSADCGVGDKINGNGAVVSNQAPGLMWGLCLVGQSGQDFKPGNAGKMNRVDALNKARGSKLAGFENWRMPKIEELESIMVNCAEQEKVFFSLAGGFIWSASANLDFATEARAFNLATGKREVVRRHEMVYVLLVRDIK